MLRRILISQVVLSPWHHGLCSKPSKHKKVAVKNLRIFASLLYFVAKDLDPRLPAISVETVMMKKELPLIPLGKVAPLPGDVALDIEEAADASRAKPKSKYLETAFNAVVNIFSQGEKVFVSSSNDVNSAYAEALLLDEKRLGYDTMQDLHNLLLPLEYFTANEATEAIFREIIAEMKRKLNRWVTKTCLLGLTTKISNSAASAEAKQSGSRMSNRARTSQSRSKMNSSPGKERLANPSKPIPSKASLPLATGRK